MGEGFIYDAICAYYGHMYAMVNRFNDYAFVPTENHNKQIHNFIALLKKEMDINSVGHDWVFNYMAYLFKERCSQKSRYGSRIPLNWVVGKKSFEIYRKRGGSWAYYTDMFICSNNIRPILKKGRSQLDMFGHYERQRAVNNRDEMPLHLCLGIVPYSRFSKYCLICPSKNDCKEINSDEV